MKPLRFGVGGDLLGGGSDLVAVDHVDQQRAEAAALCRQRIRIGLLAHAGIHNVWRPDGEGAGCVWVGGCGRSACKGGRWNEQRGKDGCQRVSKTRIRGACGKGVDDANR